MSKQLIKDLGGARQVATALGTSEGAVRNWMLADRAIPWKWRPALARLAVAQAATLPADFWEVEAA